MTFDDAAARALADPTGVVVAGVSATAMAHASSLGGSEAPWDVRLVRGEACRRFESTRQALITALELPENTGHNWNALSDFVRDMAWKDGRARILVVTSALQLLGDESIDELASFLDVAAQVVEELSEPIERGEWWDRGPLTFRCLLLAIRDGKNGRTIMIDEVIPERATVVGETRERWENR